MRAIELERTVADLAAGQWGLFTAAQARESGISRVQLARLTDADVLVRLTHGVYVLRGAAGIGELELRAAWLALDPERTAADRLRDGTAGAVVSHASAARLRQLGDLDADRHEFTLPARKQSRRHDVRLHRGAVTAQEIGTVAGLPVMTSERIVVDLLADHRDGEHVAGVIAAAVRSRSIDVTELAPRLGPFATRFGFSAGDGAEVLEHLLELGGASDLIAADDIVRTARTNRLSLAQVMQGFQGEHLPVGMSSELAKLMETIRAAQPPAGMSAELAKTTQIIERAHAAQLVAGPTLAASKPVQNVQSRSTPARPKTKSAATKSAAESRASRTRRSADEGDGDYG